MAHFTLHLNNDQKDIIVRALAVYGQMFAGQTAIEQAAARKLESHIAKAKHHTALNLTETSI